MSKCSKGNIGANQGGKDRLRATEQRLQGEGIRPRLVQLAQSEEDTDPEDVEQSEAPAYNTRERNKKKLQQRIEPQTGDGAIVHMLLPIKCVEYGMSPVNWQTAEAKGILSGPIQHKSYYGTQR
ncbi:hypothetical protein QTP70_003942 [Hemibagrus guttatus]|uniref:Uncharacterized protein n=1 Tax=Hemibagrus guttatus TaxID=175788 RepID=A0AAE0V991_9TELE|nr:hypothetical protein QTP70_003942 [Hemibagrus guttatus]KAK3571197.1 hypothetical protein QTP86_004912 [Hemibagrus guttatus]